MASTHQFSSSFFVLYLLTISVISTAGETINSSDHQTGRVYVEKIVNAIFHAGYLSMSHTLGMTLNTLIAPYARNNTNFTIFCPPDEAFLSLKYPQPPLTLLKYHIVPMKLDRESLECSSSSSLSVTLPVYSKIDTLLPGHPLVLTSFTDQLGFSSLNRVNITKWELYKDGYVVVHGTENFFNPAYQATDQKNPTYQTILCQQCDNNNRATTTTNNDDKNKSEGGNTLVNAFHNKLVLVLVIVIIILICTRCSCVHVRRR